MPTGATDVSSVRPRSASRSSASNTPIGISTTSGNTGNWPAMIQGSTPATSVIRSGLNRESRPLGPAISAATTAINQPGSESKIDGTSPGRNRSVEPVNPVASVTASAPSCCRLSSTAATTRVTVHPFGRSLRGNSLRINSSQQAGAATSTSGPSPHHRTPHSSSAECGANFQRPPASNEMQRIDSAASGTVFGTLDQGKKVGWSASTSAPSTAIPSPRRFASTIAISSMQIRNGTTENNLSVATPLPKKAKAPPTRAVRIGVSLSSGTPASMS
ncbi:MAG: hypothetical protein DSY81_01200 [Bacillota bacterium]|nr:MAG: hypothetical protein DSY92_09875 [Planctomycetota bacterium]RUA11232.1 MAG: hypothetical protein DSY81_01200 [Bacillota bacterium]